MTLFILEKKKKNIALCWFVKGCYIYIYIYILKKEHFLINSLIHLKLNSLMRKMLYYRLVIIIYDFMNILENKLYFIFYYKIIRYFQASRKVATSSI